ncbi:MAG: hypothetical protein KH268_11940 [Clostridiales bacterium]|nr:hypothetical protein [Clostridiales bacterium]
MIPVDKTEGEISKEKRAKRKIEKMSEDMENICVMLSQSSKLFDPKKSFELIKQYIDDHDRLLYADISNYIFQLRSEEAVSVFQTNLENVLEYVLSDEYTKKIENAKDRREKFKIEKPRKVVLKMYDHVNLAKRQYIELRESDEEYDEKFKRNIEPFKQEVTREMSNQLITLVGIFTAIAFVVFGGISSLDNFLGNGAKDIPILRLMILGVLWSLCMTNLIYVFLFCVGKITKLSIKSSDKQGDNLVKKYPIIFWSNYLLLSLLTILYWINFLYKRNLLKWFFEMADKKAVITSITGFVVILLLMILGAWKLIDLRKEKSLDD